MKKIKLYIRRANLSLKKSREKTITEDKLYNEENIDGENLLQTQTIQEKK